MTLPQPNRERFLAAIAERVSPDRVQALFLFAPVRQGPLEAGVAVLAIDREPPRVEEIQTPDEDVPGSPATRYPLPATPEDTRPLVLTARYTHTQKGPDRGKWELEILEQADAPMLTIEKVIQGVHQRLDETVEPERLGADDLRAALAEGVWTAPQR